MTKIKHNTGKDVTFEVFEQAKERKIIHLYDDQDSFSGPAFNLEGRPLLNFGYCGYLGLEQDTYLKEGAIKELTKNGLQFGVSRVYITSKPEQKLLSLLSRIFKNNRIIVQSSTSSSHIGNVPNLVGPNDAIVLDQQVHFSVQTGSQLCKQNGTTIDMIRHSNTEMLAHKYAKLAPTHEKIWYMVDGVYSMYGDVAPFDEIIEMLNKYPQLYLYVDDAHGMSWHGEDGAGYAFSKLQNHPKAVLNVTMGKGFGVTGGVTIFPTDELYNKVRIFGGPLTYSHPISPAVLGAAIASAKIHLSSRISQLQWELLHRIRYCEELLKHHNLPVLSHPETPIFFIGLGQPSLTYNMVRRMMSEGLYINAALFPAVSLKCSGVRFSISRHNSLSDIEKLVEAFAKHYPLVLKDEGKTDDDVRKAFKLPLMNKQFTELKTIVENKDKGLKSFWFSSINQLDEKDWNNWFSKQGNFDYQALQFLEKAFSNNNLPEENFDFKYLVIKNEFDDVVFATFLTLGILKDDFLSSEKTSEIIEQKRVGDKYFLCSKTLMMGAITTEGKHFFMDEQKCNSTAVYKELLKEIELLKSEQHIEKIILRDFLEVNKETYNVFHHQGYLKINMPNMSIYENFGWQNVNEFKLSINKKYRWHFKNDVEKYMHHIEVEVKQKVSTEELKQFIALFKNVKHRNLGVNFFDYPEKYFELMNEFSQWEFIVLKEKITQNVASVVFCYRTQNIYCPMFIGINYELNAKLKVYKRALFECLNRAREIDLKTVKLGFSADLEKRKLGAYQVPVYAFVNFEDNFNQEIIETIGAYSHK